MIIKIMIVCRFGRARHDELSILAPLYQCCVVRLSTVRTLLDFYTSPPDHKLSDRMRRSLETDPLNPILTEAHLQALDRRIGVVLNQINRCVSGTNDGDREQVIVIDGW